jgi:capsid protein
VSQYQVLPDEGQSVRAAQRDATFDERRAVEHDAVDIREALQVERSALAAAASGAVRRNDPVKGSITTSASGAVGESDVDVANSLPLLASQKMALSLTFTRT